VIDYWLLPTASFIICAAANSHEGFSGHRVIPRDMSVFICHFKELDLR